MENNNNKVIVINDETAEMIEMLTNCMKKAKDTMEKMAYFIDKRCSCYCNYETCAINKLCDAIFTDDSSCGIAPCHSASPDVIIKAFEMFDFEEYKRENGIKDE